MTTNGAVSLGFGGKGGKGRNGWDRLGAQEGWGVWSGRGNTAGPLFSTGAGEESQLCAAAWMASRSSTNTLLWLWQDLLCWAADLLDTPHTELEPALKVNTPVLYWKAFMRMQERLLLPFNIEAHRLEAVTHFHFLITTTCYLIISPQFGIRIGKFGHCFITYLVKMRIFSPLEWLC